MNMIDIQYIHDFWEQAETIVYKIIFTLKMSFLEKFLKIPTIKSEIEI